ncbi:hypothetical protein ACIG3E_23555 [Streptomyces sp. NPDC053474]|uniref:hypothetical protein n=1 Tax=Streptomyces sp. NPDC053474 TaxID=3365704 RepID=UPI0037D0345C
MSATKSGISAPKVALATAVALSILGGAAAPVGAAAAGQEAPTAYEAIERTGVLAETASDSPGKLNGTSLSQGVTLDPVGSGLVKKAADPDLPDDPETSVISNEGTAGPGRPTMRISLPAADGQARTPAAAPGADTKTGRDSAGGGLLTSPTNLPQTEAAAQFLKDGVRMMTVINGPQAPTRTQYKLSLPAGAHLEEATASYSADQPMPEGDAPMTGYVIVSADDTVLGGIEAPWATDANGKHVPTRYELDGDNLIQIVDHAGAAYPVVADPKVSFGWWVYVRFSRKEVKKVSTRIGAGVAVASAVCNLIPSDKAKAFCLAVSGYSLVHLGNVFVKAAGKKCKVEVKWAYSPVYRTKQYSCKK